MGAFSCSTIYYNDIHIIYNDVSFAWLLKYDDTLQLFASFFIRVYTFTYLSLQVEKNSKMFLQHFRPFAVISKSTIPPVWEL